MRVHRSTLARLALVAVLTMAGAGMTGCSQESDNQATDPELEAAVPDIRGPEDLDDVYSGLLDAAFVEDLPAYQEQEVTVLAAVADVLSPRAFTVVPPEGEAADPVLVVTTEEAGDVDLQEGEEWVIAASPLDQFDAEVVVEELGLGVDPAGLDEWEGGMFLVATIVEPGP